jgi:hypothetical protein
MRISVKMVKRYTGGVISGTKASISVLSSSGFFNLAEQAQAKSSNTWPMPIYTFPTVYASLISGFVGTIIYVDSSIGNDNNNGSSYITPYATIDKAHTIRATLTTTNVMIVVRPGTYSVAVMSPSGSSSSALFDVANGSTVYVCAPGKTIINFTSNANRDGSLCHFGKSASAVYGAIIRRDNAGKTLNYSTAFFNNTTATYLGTLYNCAISEVNANNAWAIQYDNGATGTGKADYCSFYVLAAGQSSYGGSTSLTVSNSTFNYGYGTDNGIHTNELTLTSHNMTSESATPPYVSPGTTTQGVYYGTYAWV